MRRPQPRPQPRCCSPGVFSSARCPLRARGCREVTAAGGSRSPTAPLGTAPGVTVTGAGWGRGRGRGWGRVRGAHSAPSPVGAGHGLVALTCPQGAGRTCCQPHTRGLGEPRAAEGVRPEAPRSSQHRPHRVLRCPCSSPGRARGCPRSCRCAGGSCVVFNSALFEFVGSCCRSSCFSSPFPRQVGTMGGVFSWKCFVPRPR